MPHHYPSGLLKLFFYRVHKDFSNVIKECYAPYSPAVEDTASFGKQNGSA